MYGKSEVSRILGHMGTPSVNVCHIYICVLMTLYLF